MSAPPRSAAASKPRLSSGVEAERAFAVARRANTIAAIDAFLAAHPASALAEEAKTLKATLLVREQAYRNALASDDAAALRSFLRAYRKGGVPSSTLGRCRSERSSKAV
jgi:hypothetical protein